MILVVSSPRDEHATVVLQHLEQLDARAELLDLSTFPRESCLALSYSAERGFGARITLANRGVISLTDVTAIWWRRPQPLDIDPTIRRSSHRAFAHSESYEALSGLWLALDTRW